MTGSPADAEAMLDGGSAAHQGRVDGTPPSPPSNDDREALAPEGGQELLSWTDTVREAWLALKEQRPDQSVYSTEEIYNVVDVNWTRCRGATARHMYWKREIRRALRGENVLAREGSSEMGVKEISDTDRWSVKNLSFKSRPPSSAKGSKRSCSHVTVDPSARQASPVERRNGAVDGEDAPMFNVTVPAEWKVLSYAPVRLSSLDKSIGISFEGDPAQNFVRGLKGFRMIRATTGVCEGDWYFEATVMPYEGDGAVRLGWSTRRSDVETPVGFDGYGFGIRDRTGEFIHHASCKPYGKPFTIGDTIGCRIRMPQLTDEQKARIAAADDAWLHYRFIGLLQGPPPQDSGICLEGGIANVEFFKNGTSMGVPEYFAQCTAPKPDEFFANGAKGGSSRRIGIRAGYYYPSVALFGNAVVKANFGPDFAHPPPPGTRCFSEAAPPPPPPPPPPPLPPPLAQSPEEAHPSPDAKRELPGENQQRSADSPSTEAQDAVMTEPETSLKDQSAPGAGQQSNPEVTFDVAVDSRSPEPTETEAFLANQASVGVSEIPEQE